MRNFFRGINWDFFAQAEVIGMGIAALMCIATWVMILIGIVRLMLGV